ncbi:MAG: 1-acyl-sn-glycerol-3-phosphate acyltransferase [Bacteroidota bacterium]
MVYRFLYALVGWCRALYFSGISVHRWPAAWTKNPVASRPRMLCANHPSSFLDAVLVAGYLPFPLGFLGRGDAFTPRFGQFLRQHLHMMPVWRQREGYVNVHRNYETFAEANRYWAKGGSLIIFSEGLCVQEWKLRPLPKGSARMAWSAYQEGLDLEIVPVGINYEHFHGPGKSADFRFGSTVMASDLIQKFQEESQGEEGPLRETVFLLRFNRWLEEELRNLVVHAPNKAVATGLEGGTETSAAPLAPTRQRWFFLTLARLLHAPYYYPIKHFAQKACRDTVHFDSVLFAILMLTYPLFLLIVSLVLVWTMGWIGLIYWVLWPVTAWFSRYVSTNP